MNNLGNIPWVCPLISHPPPPSRPGLGWDSCPGGVGGGKEGGPLEWVDTQAATASSLPTWPQTSPTLTPPICRRPLSFTCCRPYAQGPGLLKIAGEDSADHHHGWPMEPSERPTHYPWASSRFAAFPTIATLNFKHCPVLLSSPPVAGPPSAP